MKFLRALSVVLAVAAGPVSSLATTLIFPADAIDELWNLTADEFRQKYAGINVTGLGPSDEGWYVRYRHENLTFLFGPLAEREDARKRKWDMETVRDAAIRNRPSLASSQVDFVRFTFSGVYGRGGDGTGGGGEFARISPDGKYGPDGDLDGDGIPNSKDPDMDGDGIPNEQDADADGDGIPNGQDEYAFGKAPGEWGKGGAGDGATVADNSGSGQGGKDGGKDGSKSGQAGDGNEMGGGQQGGGNERGAKQVASNQRGNRAGNQGNQQGSQGNSSGQQGQQQAGQQGQGQQSSSSQSGQSGSSGQSGPPSGSSGGGGNPLSLIAALLKAVLGI